ncbi:MAG: molecular chaperone DnaJ [Actinomyces sp.]|nr:molecular chaperone DnaJ [Actinomyces sp.]MCI1691975.1 molecular chaperone DnaJ [Actinomyces sp.]MCI1786796.1 molecular chaperone DnaJ [Actinomyces sp.]MCI1829062.1 molecular chaperone DnaJ [Actinomyces sp.]MCI1866264.1 molecular chaperone DnaJ [Actinomyces sp.]
MNDYYEILGVPRDASQDQIKKAYRKKARQLHPDYAGPESEEAFKDLSVAYETLSDPQKRQMYDLGGPEAVHGGGAGGMGGDGFGFADIFESMFGGSSFASSSGPIPRARRGQDQLLAVEVTLEEETFGATKDISLDTYIRCPRCEGTCCEPGTRPQTCPVCRGTGSVTRVQRSLLGNIRTQTPCSACQGHGSTIPSPCHECSGEGRVRTRRRMSVDIPVGVDNGTRIRLSGRGEVGPAGGPAGDLYLEVREKKHPIFTRRGDDLHTWITVPMTTASLGTVFQLQTLDGPREVTIGAGTQPQEEIVLKGLGVGRLQRSGRGDLRVHVDVEIPRRLDDRARELLEQLADLRRESRVEPHRGDQSMFDRLRDKLSGQ